MIATTAKFAQLLIDARAWDQKHKHLCHIQEEYLLENFTFADDVCRYCNKWDAQAWEVPYLTPDGKPFTRCV